MRGVVFGIIALASVIVGPAAQAGPTSAAERESLAALATEIEFLEIFVEAAEGRAHDDARKTFDYQSLRSKFDEIKAQLDVYLAGERKQPRQLHSMVRD